MSNNHIITIPNVKFDSSFQAIQNNNTVLIVPIYEGCDMHMKLQSLNLLKNGAIQECLSNSVFTGKNNDSLSVLIKDNEQETINILFIGIGKQKELKTIEGSNIGAKVAKHIIEKKIDNISVLLPFSNLSSASSMILGFMTKIFVFDKYFTQNKPFKLTNVTFISDDSESINKNFTEELLPIIKGSYFAQNLIMEPANELGPEEFIEDTKEFFKNISSHKLKIEVLDEKTMYKMEMHSLLGVGQGSLKPSKLLVIKWTGATEEEPFLSLVGKGVTFDNGGVSLKPANHMWEMKADMSGAAIITGLMYTLANRDAKANVVAILGLVENAIGANAQRPGDIVKSMSGKTIEILNTDAEGRLVLADALWYAQTVQNSTKIIDLATLTGAVCVALGNVHAGLFANNNKLAKEIIESSNLTNERVWRLPMGPEHDNLLTSDCADIKNIETKRLAGGSIAAAKFLEFFIKKETEWVHLDIAGVTKYHDEVVPDKSYYAFGLKMLNHYIKHNLEIKN